MYGKTIKDKFQKYDSIIMGFFFVFIYKDFVLRELFDKFSRIDHSDSTDTNFDLVYIHIMDKEYQEFMDNNLAQWI